MIMMGTRMATNTMIVNNTMRIITVDPITVAMLFGIASIPGVYE